MPGKGEVSFFCGRWRWDVFLGWSTFLTIIFNVCDGWGSEVEDWSGQISNMCHCVHSLLRFIWFNHLVLIYRICFTEVHSVNLWEILFSSWGYFFSQVGSHQSFGCVPLAHCGECRYLCSCRLCLFIQPLLYVLCSAFFFLWCSMKESSLSPLLPCWWPVYPLPTPTPQNLGHTYPPSHSQIKAFELFPHCACLQI